jgi:hypothetical protein
VARYLEGRTDRDMRSNAVVRALQNLRATLKLHPG